MNYNAIVISSHLFKLIKIFDAHRQLVSVRRRYVKHENTIKEDFILHPIETSRNSTISLQIGTEYYNNKRVGTLSEIDVSLGNFLPSRHSLTKVQEGI